MIDDRAAAVSAMQKLSTKKRAYPTIDFTVNRLLIFPVIMAVFVIGCKITTTKEKPPIFDRNTDSIKMALNRLVFCQGINVTGKEIDRARDTISVLEIEITNGKNIPSDKDQMVALARQIALVIKGALQDKNEYESYNVRFVIRTQDGDVTHITWKGKIFSSRGL